MLNKWPLIGISQSLRGKKSPVTDIPLFSMENLFLVDPNNNFTQVCLDFFFHYYSMS